jgi:ABC-type branched-subunit amino acid transport system substrate-binding protein
MAKAIERRQALKYLGYGLGAAAGTSVLGFPSVLRASKHPVKMGILTSLTGVHAIFGETMLRCAQFAHKEINDKGGIAGRKLELVIEDDESDPKVGIEKARKLIKREKVEVIVGAISSAMRNAVGTVTTKEKTVFVYPTYYEGGYCHEGVFVTGAIPNQQIEPFVPWIMENVGKTFYIAGSDYIWPKETAKVVRALVEKQGGQVVAPEEYFPWNTGDFSSLVNRVARAKPAVMYSLLIGSDSVTFLKQFHNFGLKKTTRVCTSGVAEKEAAGLGEAGVGIVSSQSYFMTLDTPRNKEFLDGFRRMFPTEKVVDSIAEGMYNGVHVGALAVAKAGTSDWNALNKAFPGVRFNAPQGEIWMADNRHAALNSIIAECVNDKGELRIIKNFGVTPPKVTCFQ